MKTTSLLLFLPTFLTVTTGTIYIVTSDGYYHPNTTCHHCHNLQYYLLNITKYFTSNIQLLFLPGEYHINITIIIQNVHNISLIGNDTVLISTVPSSSFLSIINSSEVTIKNFVIHSYSTSHYRSLHLENCFSISLHNVIMHMIIKGYNVMGESVLSNITSYGIKIIYDDNNTSIKSNSIHKLIMYNMTQNGYSNIQMMKLHYEVSIIITDSVFSEFYWLQSVIVNITSSCATHYKSTIIFNRIHFFNNNHLFHYLLDIHFHLHHHHQCSNKTISKRDKVEIKNCFFVNNDVGVIISGKWHDGVIKVEQNILITDCLFVNNTISSNILLFESESAINTTVYIISSKFLFNAYPSYTHYFNQNPSVITSNIRIQLIGPIIFHNNTFDYLFIMMMDLFLHYYVEFSQNEGKYLIYGSHISLVQPVILNITENNIAVTMLLFKNESDTSTNFILDIPLCYFQFYGNNANTTNDVFEVLIKGANSSEIFNRHAENTNCRMLPGSAFYEQNPLDVYKRFIHFQNNYGQYFQLFDTGTLCYCSKEKIQNCFTNTMGPIFPGQTLTISLYINYKTNNIINTIPISIDMYNSKYLTKSHCKVHLANQIFKWITRNCTTFHFTILSNNEQQCELFLNAKNNTFITIFYVKLLNCQMGFSLDIEREKCQCDLLMNSKLLTISDCNINNQSILRPANSWISADNHNHSYVYHISPSCPLQYCLPHASYLNFLTPNSQCQFNRSGLLCGQCQQNLSAIFGSSNCQLCSNIYLLLIIPITIAGLLLVFILFCINLTVTDGIINAFIMYTNIIGINDHVFFTDTKHVFTPAYIFISLANLDLGIQTCFYNGMDDYAKMWLQLAFPFYLMFIATLLIITSRYSITVQRLTARRALPVLATLFLLSYTKILRTVSSVLFSYSIITHLPSKHTTLVWWVDANVPLFHIKFTILFIVCLILFLVLIPFNIILLCTRTLSQFQFINKFKPILDAYQGPYKHRFYYWTGLQLLIRAVFFGISALDKNTNLLIGSIILCVIIGLHGVVCPFKIKFKNYNELLYVINLQILYILTLSYCQGATTVNVMVTLASVQFIFIIIYHIITYPYSGVIRIKISDFINTVTTWVSKFNKRSSNVGLQLHTIDIPEVTYNYREYREPLIGED